MSQRFTIDRSSFEQVLCATSLIQQLNRQVRNGHVPDQDAPQPLSDLVEAQLAIETETIDLEAAMNRVVGLAVKLSRATGAATWLFSGHKFVYRAGTGNGANDERLQLDTLSELASICGPSDHEIHDPHESNHWSPAYDAIHYPGSVKSLLVAPIYHGRSVVGALAVFSVEFNAFTECDATNARLLSGLLTHALGKAAEAELKQNVSLERATMLLAIDQLIPALRKLAKEKRESHGSPNGLPPLFTELEPGSKLTTVQAPGASTLEPGDGALESSDSLSALRVVTDRTEFELTDRLMMQTGKGRTRDVADNSSSPAYSALEPKRARESTCATVPPNISTLCSEALAAAAKVQRDSPFWSLTGLTELAHRQLSKARFWLATTTDILGGLLAIATYQLRPSAPARLRLKLPMLSRAVVLAAVLLIMLVFLFSITRASYPSNAAVAPSEASTAAKLMTTTEPSQDLHQRSGPFPAFKLSHMQVTDPAVSSALRNLSRHEIVGLRRRAAYGDDSAALLLGMAYETGHLVPQNCIKAREWVTESANEGNAAAQYNLGLRYRQGDGEPVNQEVGAQWLRKAAAQKYSQAQLALESLP
jgi:Sel1 repeat